MSSSDNLDELMEDYWPLLQGARAFALLRKWEARLMYSSGELIEFYSLLRIGASLDFFDIEQCASIARLGPSVSEAHQERLQYCFTDDVMRPFVEAVSTGNWTAYFQRAIPFERKQDIRPSFQTFLLIHTRFATNDVAQTFLSNLNFTDDNTWEQLSDSSLYRPYLLEAFLRGEVGIPNHDDYNALLAGLYKLLEYLGTLQRVLEDTDSLYLDDVFRFKSAVRRLCAWRLRKTVFPARERFRKIAEQFENVAIREAALSRVELSRGYFKEVAEGLLEGSQPDGALASGAG